MQSCRSETLAKPWDTQRENSNQMPLSFICATPPRFLHCCNSSPSVSENRMCPSFAREVPSWQSQLCLLLSWTAVASISHPRLSLSGTDNTGGAGYSIPPQCISLLFERSHFPLWSLSIALCFTVMSNFKLICSQHCTLLSLCPQASASSCPGQPGLNSWPEFRAVNFLNKVSFNET